LIDDTVWFTSEIGSWEIFLKAASTVADTDPTGIAYLCRGQADSSWDLRPTLLRNLPPTCTPQRALEIEAAALEEFKAQAHLYYEAADLPQSFGNTADGDWWALMQHHGAPTRLLDWTSSPYVAAYFAAEQLPDTPGAIYIVHPATVNEEFDNSFPEGIEAETLLSANAPNLLFFRSPPKKTLRLVAQQGQFSYSVNILGRHDELIGATSRTSPQGEIKAGVVVRYTVEAFGEPLVPSGDPLQYEGHARLSTIAWWNTSTA
jgi:hypothetical protein